MKKLFLILMFPLLVANCHFSNKYENRESDLKAAEKITSELFSCIKKSDFAKATELFGEEFYAVTSKEDLMKIFESSETKLGVLNSTKLADWNTMVSEGAIEQGVYNLNYDAAYEKETAKLKLTLLKNDKGDIKVVGFNVQSRAFLE
jgi:hypothetical protein